MKTILILEDEEKTARRLERLLNGYYQGQVDTTILPSVAESLQWLKNNPDPEIIFMDIRLSDGLSLDIFQHTEIRSFVVFTTAYDEYALQAFQVNGIDYLLKPLDPELLYRSLEKITRYQYASDNRELAGIMRMVQERKKVYRSRFLVNFREVLIPVPVHTIAYFVSEFKVTYIITVSNNKHAIDPTLEELEQELDPAAFFRVTRQIIVSHTAIHKIHIYFNGRLKLDILPLPKEEVIVSRDRAAALKSWLDR
ncbi:MAG: response regulator transcription factor [Chitinophagaceae bacterium]|nr:response regulator transcription factor [Chitinophagaceae bacterium]